MIAQDVIAPTSFAQQRLWFLEQLAPGRPLYNMSVPIRLAGAIDATCLEAALNGIVRRHGTLRTTFRLKHGEPVQVVAPEGRLSLRQLDLRRVSTSEQETEVRRVASEELHHRFDLERGPLLRAALLHIAEAEYVFIVTMHHIVSVGWSMQVFSSELQALYEAFLRGRPSPLPELPIQYTDFAAHQRQELEGHGLSTGLGYWKEQLRDLPTLTLPTDRPRPPEPTFEGRLHSISFDAGLTDRLRALSRGEGATLFMTLLAAFNVLLARYSGQSDIAVGTPVANRTRAELEGLIGFFVNALVLRTRVDPHLTFRELLHRVRETALGAYAHQDLPFEKLVAELHPERDPARNPLFQVMFQVFSPLGGAATNAASATPAVPSIQRGTAHVDLSLDLLDTPQGLRGSIEYSTDLFDEQTVERLAAHYQTLLAAIVADPELPLCRLPLLPEAELQRLLVDWNATHRDYPDVTCCDLFESQCLRTPNAIALVFEDESMTYAQLNAAADRLAMYLRTRGVDSNARVGIFLERSPRLVSAVLAVLKAGAAYVPLSPAHPHARLAFQVTDSGVCVVLTQRALADRLAGIDVICLDDPALDLHAVDDEIREPRPEPWHAAYIAYTSGSTGAPKGVIVQHRALANHLQWHHEAVPLGVSDRVLLKYDLSFDVAALELLGPLTCGASLIIAQPGGHFDTRYLVSLIRQHSVTAIDMVPSQLDMLLEDPGFATCTSLRWVTSGGEALSVSLAQRLLQTLDITVHNMYGPTEATIGATAYRCSTAEAPDTPNIPIGQPIANTRAYVVDETLQPVPVGVFGELLLGGVCVARGYAGRPRLTAQRFVPDPFGAPGDRLYRTGDRVRWRSDGVLEFGGRFDAQVKIRGVRVEPGEIEAALASHPGVGECAVFVRDDAPGEQHLVACIVPIAEGTEFWPCVGEHFVYDDLLYYAMTNDRPRTDAYRAAIERVVPGRTVLDIGTGADAILARMCLDAGARHVYAVERLDFAYRAARTLLKRLRLESSITLLHGDVKDVRLSEPVDVCVSEILGMIASAEGAVSILNEARRFLAPGGVSVPWRASTRMAAVTLPEDVVSGAHLSALSEPLVERVFEAVGHPFDVRLAVKNLSRECLLSDWHSFEELDFSAPIEAECRSVHRLEITKTARLQGLVLWLHVVVGAGLEVDALEDNTSWLPVFFPAFFPGQDVEPGDIIEAVCTRVLSDDGTKPDYRVSGRLLRGGQVALPFDYASPHHGSSFRGNPFYTRLFGNASTPVAASTTPALSARQLREHLEHLLPGAMVPSAFVTLPELPRTPGGKIDRQRLAHMASTRLMAEPAYVPPRTDLERKVSSIWQDVLGVESVGTTDNFFDLGGHSLLMMRVQSRLRELAGVDVRVVDLFRYPTVSALANHVRQLRQHAAVRLPVQNVLERAAKQRAAVAHTGGPPLGGRLEADKA